MKNNKKDLITIIVLIVIMVLLIILESAIGSFYNIAKDHAKIILHVGDIQNLNVLGDFKFYYILSSTLRAISLLMILIIWIIVIIKAIIMIKKKTYSLSIIKLILIAFIVSILCHDYFLDYALQTATRIHVSPCWCGKDYFKVEHK